MASYFQRTLGFVPFMDVEKLQDHHEERALVRSPVLTNDVKVSWKGHKTRQLAM